MKHSLEQVQAALADEGLAGWLLYDFRGSNPLALELLALPAGALLTRRFFYWIPAVGAPVRLQSAVERHHFAHLPGEQRLFRGWRELAAARRVPLARLTLDPPVRDALLGSVT